MSDRQFAVSNDWALAADRLQWILQRRRTWKGKVEWHAVSFVSSTKEILARCMHEKGVPPEDAQRLLEGLPSTFKEWLAGRASSLQERDDEPGHASATLAAE
jgi:hypothetical protein